MDRSEYEAWKARDFVLAVIEAVCIGAALILLFLGIMAS